MIRKFNFTGRRRISQSLIRISLTPIEGGAPSFDAHLNISSLDLPREAAVYVEAYDKSSYVRFHYGTMGAPQEPSQRQLSELQSRDRILFRVKVVDTTVRNGRVLAIADRLPPATLQKTAIEKEGLLGVRPASLGEMIWRLEFEENGPILELNEDLPGISEMATGNGIFIGLVYPEVFRQILLEAAGSDDSDDAESDNWKGAWLQYARQLGATLNRQANREEKLYWIDHEAVPAFCRYFQILARFKATRSGEQA